MAFSARIADPVITLVALWATLRPKPLRWWMAGLIVAAILLQTAAFHTIHNAYPLWGGGVRTWKKSFALVCEGDPLYRGPLIGVLLLARAAGYRLVLALGRGNNEPSADLLDSAG